MDAGSAGRTVLLVQTPPLRYQEAWDIQNALFQRRKEDRIPDVLMLTEHPPVYTLGKSGKLAHLLWSEDALQARNIDLHWIDRGGDITFHGPGQIVGYPIFDLHGFYLDVGRFLRDLEEVLIRALADFDVKASRVPGLTGVWTDKGKIAAIGIKVSRWITKHGFALNVHPDLEYFTGIVPCGISDRPVTSMAAVLAAPPVRSQVLDAITRRFSEVFTIDLEMAILDQLLK